MRSENMMKVTAVCLVLLLATALPAVSGAAEKDKGAAHASGREAAAQAPGTEVVAKVNGVAITAAALNARVRRVLKAKGHGTSGQEDFRAMARNALDKLIVQELAYQKARAEGMKVAPGELDAIIASLKKRAGGAEKYREMLKRNHVTEATVRRELERNRLVKRIFERDVLSKVVMTEGEIKQEYEKTKEDYVIPEKVLVDDIVLFLDLNAKDSLEKADAIRKEINQEKDKDPRKIPSNGNFIVREIELHRNKQKELYDAAVKMKEGEVSGVIKTADSYHIIKLKQYSPARDAGFDEVKGYVEARLKAEKVNKLMVGWEKSLKKGAKIEILNAQGKFEEQQ